ncbi:MAG: hypothetical protein E6G03_07205 [Actinobacteria bacterium]|nr:MAG: hypothetical protein E6G03_07205 [Actinomycetota bacterium]
MRPAVYFVARNLAEKVVLRRRVGNAQRDLIGGRDPRVVAVEANRPDELIEFRPFAHAALVAEELRAEGPVRAPLDRNNRLGEQVAPHHRRIGLVEVRRAQELAPEDVRAVDVRRVKELHTGRPARGSPATETH